MKPLKCLSLTVLLWGSTSPQAETQLKKTVETIKTFDGIEGTKFIGFDNERPIFMKILDQQKNRFAFYLIDEGKSQRFDFDKPFIPPMDVSNWKTGYLKIEKYFNDFWLYSIGFASEDYKTYYQNLWIQYKGGNYKLDSIYNADKKIHSAISGDGKHLIVSTLNYLTDYYNKLQDNSFKIFSLDEIKNGQVKMENVDCQFCSNIYFNGNDLVFARSDDRDDFEGGYSWTNIYSAPLNQIANTEMIAGFADITALSADGQFILANRVFDLPNRPRAIINVRNKRYQLLLGRNYSKAQAFYSFFERKFAFHFGNHIVYVDFPDQYPFPTLRKNNPDIPHPSQREFYKQFMHPSLD